MMKWMKVEMVLSKEHYKLSSATTLRRCLLIMTIIYSLLSLIEHLFSLSAEIFQVNMEIGICNRTDAHFPDVFIKKQFNFIVERLPFKYNNFLGFILEYLNFSYIFYWNFLDLLIILISMGLANLYEKINWRLEGFIGLLVNETVWAEMRSHHVQVSELIKIMNENINELLIVACFSDGYFILSQASNIIS